jgi:hypothetical protein
MHKSTSTWLTSIYDACVLQHYHSELPSSWHVLTQSLREHHPEARVVILIVDETQASRYSEEFEVLTPGDANMEQASLHELAAMYDANELCVSQEPALALHLLATTEEPIVYLDADILVLSRLDGVEKLARQYGLVLTPPYLQPVPYLGSVADRDRWKMLPPSRDDRALLRYGQFQAGFFAVTGVDSSMGLPLLATDLAPESIWFRVTDRHVYRSSIDSPF